MKLFLSILIGAGVALSAVGVDFGAEANKSAVKAKRSVLIERINKLTQERVAFEATLDAKQVAQLRSLKVDSAEADRELQKLVGSAVEKLETDKAYDKKAIQLVDGNSSTKVTNSPTTAWCGIYYGYIVYRFIYYVRLTIYYPLHGYYWTVHYQP